MQAQVEKTKGELLSELRAKVVTTTIKELSPNGIRLEINGMGEVKGKLDRDHMETANLLVKLDGTFEWETKSIETTKEGDMIVAWGGGKGRPTGPTTSSWEGEVQYMTQSPRLSWINNTSALVEGTWDRAAGEYQGKAYAKK